MNAPPPNELWEQATSELIAAEGAGWSADRRTARYIELMREHGHIIDRKKGDESPRGGRIAKSGDAVRGDVHREAAE